jgi:phosphoglycolate phosphatase
MSAGLERAWDAYDIYLFDVDGTLLRCEDAVHYFAFCDALRTISGLPLDLQGVSAHGNTDIGILRDALALAGVEDALWRPRLAQIRSLMSRFVEERQSELCVSVLPQVHGTLRHLRNRRALLGIASGNLQRIGELKLERAGLLTSFQFYGWSDDFEFRADVFHAALSKARAIAEHQALACVIGDTPADIAAARSNGLPVIAVATGIHGFEELAAAQPDLCLHSFADLPVLASYTPTTEHLATISSNCAAR